MLDRATVDHIAELAKIALADDEREVLRTPLAHIIESVDGRVTHDVDPAAATGGVGPTAARWRDDVPAPSLAHDAVLAPTPESAASKVRVPALRE